MSFLKIKRLRACLNKKKLFKNIIIKTKIIKGFIIIYLFIFVIITKYIRILQRVVVMVVFSYSTKHRHVNLFIKRECSK